MLSASKSTRRSRTEARRKTLWSVGSTNVVGHAKHRVVLRIGTSRGQGSDGTTRSSMRRRCVPLANALLRGHGCARTDATCRRFRSKLRRVLSRDDRSLPVDPREAHVQDVGQRSLAVSVDDGFEWSQSAKRPLSEARDGTSAAYLLREAHRRSYAHRRSIRLHCLPKRCRRVGGHLIGFGKLGSRRADGAYEATSIWPLRSVARSALIAERPVHGRSPMTTRRDCQERTDETRQTRANALGRNARPTGTMPRSSSISSTPRPGPLSTTISARSRRERCSNC